jgi:hypothetical protein
MFMAFSSVSALEGKAKCECRSPLLAKETARTDAELLSIPASVVVAVLARAKGIVWAREYLEHELQPKCCRRLAKYYCGDFSKLENTAATPDLLRASASNPKVRLSDR